ncbi:hypothetical protein EB093_09235, partial [bacterium]|nr:hypothetical protein [bacterium]
MYSIAGLNSDITKTTHIMPYHYGAEFTIVNKTAIYSENESSRTNDVFGSLRLLCVPSPGFCDLLIIILLTMRESETRSSRYTTIPQWR